MRWQKLSKMSTYRVATLFNLSGVNSGQYPFWDSFTALFAVYSIRIHLITALEASQPPRPIVALFIEGSTRSPNLFEKTNYFRFWILGS